MFARLAEEAREHVNLTGSETAFWAAVDPMIARGLDNEQIRRAGRRGVAVPYVNWPRQMIARTGSHPEVRQHGRSHSVASCWSVGQRPRLRELH
jgi:hypothetical protein